MGPAHGWWCGAVTWPTRCQHCDEPVFFFRCGCGSKVFFDELGPPWPIHDCDTSWTRNLIRVRDGSGGVTVQLSEGVSVSRAPEAFSVETEVISAADRRAKRPEADPIVRVDPDGTFSPITVVGVLREIRGEIDVVKSLNLPSNTSMTRAAIGPLGKDRWGRVTVHEPSASDQVRHSYTFWTRTKVLRKNALDKGITVWAEIQPLQILGAGPVWQCTYFEPMG